MSADSDTLLLRFLGRQTDLTSEVRRDSVEIAPPGTYTDDWNWRDQLKRGSLLDCCDDQGTWRRSCVLDRYETELTDVEGDRVTVLLIAKSDPGLDG